MRLTRLTPPVALPVTLGEAEDHLRLDADDPGLGHLGTLIEAAVAHLDGPEGLLGRCLIAQSWRADLDVLGPTILLPLPPAISVERVLAIDAEGAETEIDPADWRVAGLGNREGAILRPALGKSWPAHDAAAVEFTAGFGPLPTDVPMPLRAAILLHVAHLYEHRESVFVGSGTMSVMPQGYDDLIRPWRLWSF